MKAFVLSGGGNRGALQVGAMQVLLSQGIVPDVLVGTSVGAINAAFLAPAPDVKNAQELERLWEQVTDDDVYPGGRLTVLWRLLKRRNSFYSSSNLYRFLRQHMPSTLETFGNLTAVELYIVATHLESGRMHVFGEQPDDRVIDAIMASTALPPLHPPWCVEGEYYVDGGAVSDLPLRVAVEKGAREIYALHLPASNGALPLVHSLRDIAGRAITALVQQQVALDFESVARAQGITLHHIELDVPQQMKLSVRDFSRSGELVAAGREQTERYLETRGTQPATRRQRFVATVRKTTSQVRSVFETSSHRESPTLSGDQTAEE